MTTTRTRTENGVESAPPGAVAPGKDISEARVYHTEINSQKPAWMNGKKNDPDTSEDHFLATRIIGGYPAKIRAGDIAVDTYQRLLNEQRVKRMATHWHDTGPIRVSLRNGTDQHYVYDGQHRLKAFIARYGEDAEIDCWVEHLDRDEEAKRFATQYRDAVKVQTHQILHALAEIDDPHATGLKKLLDSYSLVPSQNLGGVNTVSQLYRRDPLALELVLGIFHEAWGAPTRHDKENMIPSMLYAGMFDVIYYHRHELDRERMVDVLRMMPPLTLAFKAMQTIPGRTKLTERAAYAQFLTLYNGRSHRQGSKLDALEDKEFRPMLAKRWGRDPV